MIMKKAAMEELSWGQIREEFSKVNPVFAKIIDELSPGPEYTLFKCTYPFGAEIMKRGVLQIPNEHGQLVSLKSSEVSADIKDKLNYNGWSNPTSVILKNSAEIFCNTEKGTVFLPVLTAGLNVGTVSGIWLILNSNKSPYTPIFIWDMTAGARSIFMLPKISEALKYNKLKKMFALKSEPPKNMADYHNFFAQLANHKDFGEDWSLEILFFSKNWFKKLLNDKAWIYFKDYLMTLAWSGSEYWRNQFIQDLIFSLIKKECNIKPHPHIDDVAKHLLAIGLGIVPGFAPTIDDTAGPISKIQKIITNIYDLKDYAPIVMQPQNLTLSDTRPVYYALQYPTTIEFSPRSRQEINKIQDLYEIQLLLQKYLSEIAKHNFNLEGTLFNTLSQKVQYDFFHSNVAYYSSIRPSEDIPKEDPTFLAKFKHIKNNQFPTNSSFVRGCIRIKQKN